MCLVFEAGVLVDLEHEKERCAYENSEFLRESSATLSYI
jgi:hypothetical protein